MGGKDTRVRATLAEGTERERQLALLLAMWPAYATYQKRAHGRDLRVFRLAAAFVAIGATGSVRTKIL